MTDTMWKVFERTVARWFGCEREPGSGAHRTGANQRTGSDSQHPRLWISCKHTGRGSQRQPAIVTEWLTARDGKRGKGGAKAEGKTPIVCVRGRGMSGFLVTLHCDDLLAVADARREAMLDHCYGGE